MNLFIQYTQKIKSYFSNAGSSGNNKYMGVAVVFLLLLSVVMTVQVLQLQQEIRQRASDKCMENPGAACNNNNKFCCSGMTCVLDPDKENGQGKCEIVPTSVPPTEVPPTSVPPTAVPPTDVPQSNPTSVYVPPTVTPLPTVTDAPIPTPDSGIGGTSGEEGQPTLTPIPTVTPTPEAAIGGTGPTPIPVQCGPNGCGSSSQSNSGGSTTNAPAVQVCTTTFNGPKQLVGTRLSPTSIRFNWWPTPGGADNQLIQYGLENGKPLWGLMKIAGDQGQIVVTNLPANRIIWAQVRAYRGNCYEDTGWVSVGTSYLANNPASVTQQPNSAINPTSGSKITALHAISPTPGKNGSGLFLIGATWNIPWLLALLALLLLLAFLYRRYFLLLLFKKRRKKKEE